MSKEKYLTASDCARRYGVARETIWRWHKADKMPKVVEVAGAGRWRLSELEKAEEDGLLMRVDQRYNHETDMSRYHRV